MLDRKSVSQPASQTDSQTIDRLALAWERIVPSLIHSLSHHPLGGASAFATHHDTNESQQTPPTLSNAHAHQDACTRRHTDTHARTYTNTRRKTHTDAQTRAHTHTHTHARERTHTHAHTSVLGGVLLSLRQPRGVQPCPVPRRGAVAAAETPPTRPNGGAADGGRNVRVIVVVVVVIVVVVVAVRGSGGREGQQQQQQQQHRQLRLKPAFLQCAAPAEAGARASKLRRSRSPVRATPRTAAGGVLRVDHGADAGGR